MNLACTNFIKYAMSEKNTICAQGKPIENKEKTIENTFFFLK